MRWDWGGMPGGFTTTRKAPRTRNSVQGSASKPPPPLSDAARVDTVRADLPVSRKPESQSTATARGPPTLTGVVRPAFASTPLDEPPSPQEPVIIKTDAVKNFDLLDRVKDLYRLLDLYSEDGNGGYVDKVIIAQDSLGSLLNNLLPGSYRDVTRIDLAALDKLAIKTVGIYGSKSEIVRFLRKMNAVDDDTAGLLLIPEDGDGEIVPRLRSGLYLFTNGIRDVTSTPPTFYLIYWPEETTWDDTAEESIRRNCVTFIRYLTQLTNEVRVLMSPEHASAFVWNEEEALDGSEFGPLDNLDIEGDDDRFVRCEVDKVHDEEERVDIEEGFSLKDPNIMSSSTHAQSSHSAPSIATSQLLQGEARPTFVTSETFGRHIQVNAVNMIYAATKLRTELRNPQRSLLLGDQVDEATVSTLFQLGAFRDAPEAASIYVKYSQGPHRRQDVALAMEQSSEQIAKILPVLEAEARRIVQHQYEQTFPTLSLSQSFGELNPGYLPEGDQSFAEICRLYPEVPNVLHRILRDVEWDVLQGRDYLELKARLTSVLDTLNGDMKYSSRERAKLIAPILQPAAAPSNTARHHARASFHVS